MDGEFADFRSENSNTVLLPQERFEPARRRSTWRDNTLHAMAKALPDLMRMIAPN